MAPLQVGSLLPNATVSLNGEIINLRDYFSRNTGLIFGGPGAFTAQCTEDHLPGYRDLAVEIKKHVDFLGCIYVNDPCVLKAWAREVKIEDEVTFISDFKAQLSRCLGMAIDLSADGLGIRCRRFAAVVWDSKVQWLGFDEDSFADVVLELLPELLRTSTPKASARSLTIAPGAAPTPITMAAPMAAPTVVPMETPLAPMQTPPPPLDAPAAAPAPTPTPPELEVMTRDLIMNLEPKEEGEKPKEGGEGGEKDAPMHLETASLRDSESDVSGCLSSRRQMLITHISKKSQGDIPAYAVASTSLTEEANAPKPAEGEENQTPSAAPMKAEIASRDVENSGQLSDRSGSYVDESEYTDEEEYTTEEETTARPE